jgi:hypothetical protein
VEEELPLFSKEGRLFKETERATPKNKRDKMDMATKIPYAVFKELSSLLVSAV